MLGKRSELWERGSSHPNLFPLTLELKARAMCLGWLRNPVALPAVGAPSLGSIQGSVEVVNPRFERFLFRLLAGTDDDAAVAAVRSMVRGNTWHWATQQMEALDMMRLRSLLIRQMRESFPDDFDRMELLIGGVPEHDIESLENYVKARSIELVQS